MEKYVQDALTGFRSFTDNGKLLAVAVALAIYLCCRDRREEQGNGEKLAEYTLLTAFLCVCPVTAAGLMLYQTRFYDYQWIFSIVPLTAVIGLGAASLVWNIWSQNQKGKALLFTGICLFILVCAGRFGATEMFEKDVTREDSQVTETEASVRELLKEIPAGEESYCLWAPQAVLKYVRSIDADYRLLYGRNMWDEALNAYSYDTYPEEIRKLYIWMEEAAASPASVSGDEVRRQVQKAGENDVTMVLLPSASVAGGLPDAVTVKGYYLIMPAQYHE